MSSTGKENKGFSFDHGEAVGDNDVFSNYKVQSSCEVSQQSSSCDSNESIASKELTIQIVEKMKESSTTDTAFIEDEEENERGHWGNHMEFILSVIGYAVGLGNVWRFPYLCYRNGGGCFVIVYWILSALIGFPTVFFEQSLGVYTSLGSLHCWGFAPVIRGVGIAMVIFSAFCAIWYNVIISWAMFMLFGSFQSKLPFSTCDYDSWADFRCEMKPCNKTGASGSVMRATDGLCYNTSYLSSPVLQSSDAYNITTCLSGENQSEACINFVSDQVALAFRNTSTVLGFWDENIAFEHNVDSKLSTEQYFYYYVLRQFDGFNTDNLGTPAWSMTLTLLLAWIIVFCCLIKGIQSSGKVVYFSAIFPYVILFIFIGRGVTLPGSYDGIMFFLKPDFEKIKEPSVWFAAANQLFFSISCCTGGMITLSSYNKFNNNVLRDAMISVVADSCTSLIAGIAIFSMIGYGAMLLGKPVDQVATAGTGLAFVIYPKILMELPGSVAWAIAFFLMIIFLGLDSQFNIMEIVITSALDQMPYFRGTHLRKACLVATLCFFLFLLGIPLICNGGAYLMTAVDLYASGFGFLTIGAIELLAVAWIYGTKNYNEDLRLILGSTWKSSGFYYITAFWGFITPGIILTIMAYMFVSQTSLAPGQTDQTIGCLCAVFGLMWIPIVAIYEIATAKSGGSLWQRLCFVCTPNKKWGPLLVRHRRLVKHLGPDYNIDPRKRIQKKSTLHTSETGVFTVKTTLPDFKETGFGTVLTIDLFDNE